MNTPNDLRYTKEHEWIKIDGDQGVIGITQFAQDQLGDVVFVELPAVGTLLKQNQQFGVVESVKTVSDLYSPVTGRVVAINPDLDSSPELVNQDPYDRGWMIKIALTEPAELEHLLDASAYDTYIKEAGH